jgi:hypothetical protein
MATLNPNRVNDHQGVPRGEQDCRLTFFEVVARASPTGQRDSSSGSLLASARPHLTGRQEAAEKIILRDLATCSVDT